MKAIIEEVKFVKDFETQFGTLYKFIVSYDGKRGVYNSKSKEQNKFVPGQEVEITEETRSYTDGAGNNVEYYVIKPVYTGGKGAKQSNYGKALSREASRYSGFSDSYVKDLLMDGIIKPEVDEAAESHNDIVMMTWKKRAQEIFEHMVILDKTIV